MKVSRVSGWIVIAAALSAGSVMFGFWNWTVRREAEVCLDQALRLESRNRALRAEVETGSLRIRELEEAFGIASNRLVEVERRLEEERTTHDPLRLQIEQMLTEQIRLRDSLSQRDKVIAKLEADLKKAGERRVAPETPTVSPP